MLINVMLIKKKYIPSTLEKLAKNFVKRTFEFVIVFEFFFNVH